MKNVKKYLGKLRIVKKKHYHPLIHKIHREHKISKKTLFYIKEYGPNANVPKRIIKESIKILFFASIISSVGGLALEHLKTTLVSLMPLLVLIPVLNDMIGDYGTIISSKFSTLLHTKRDNRWWIDKELKKLFLQIMVVSIFTTIFSTTLALVITSFMSEAPKMLVYKLFFITIIDVIILVSILFLIAIVSGIYIYRRNEDPSNFLIPITTSVADFANMIILSALVVMFL